MKHNIEFFEPDSFMEKRVHDYFSQAMSAMWLVVCGFIEALVFVPADGYNPPDYNIWYFLLLMLPVVLFSVVAPAMVRTHEANRYIGQKNRKVDCYHQFKELPEEYQAKLGGKEQFLSDLEYMDASDTAAVWHRLDHLHRAIVLEREARYDKSIAGHLRETLELETESLNQQAEQYRQTMNSLM